MTYEQHMTTEYDAQFAVEDLAWYPWVGKDYHETGIFILGHTTSWDSSNVEISRYLAAWVNDEKDVPFDYENLDPTLSKSFKTFSNMFIDETGCSREKFWRSVAFNNFCQCPVRDKFDPCGCAKQSVRAYRKTVDILTPKPRIVLAWGVKSIDHITENYDRCERISGTYPRVADGDIPIVCVRHPSVSFSGSKWLDFLRKKSVSKKPIDAFLQHLKQTIN